MFFESQNTELFTRSDPIFKTGPTPRTFSNSRCIFGENVFKGDTLQMYSSLSSQYSYKEDLRFKSSTTGNDEKFPDFCNFLWITDSLCQWIRRKCVTSVFY